MVFSGIENYMPALKTTPEGESGSELPEEPGSEPQGEPGSESPGGEYGSEPTPAPSIPVPRLVSMELVEGGPKVPAADEEEVSDEAETSLNYKREVFSEKQLDVLRTMEANCIRVLQIELQYKKGKEKEKGKGKGRGQKQIRDKLQNLNGEGLDPNPKEYAKIVKKHIENEIGRKQMRRWNILEYLHKYSITLPQKMPIEWYRDYANALMSSKKIRDYVLKSPVSFSYHHTANIPGLAESLALAPQEPLLDYTAEKWKKYPSLPHSQVHLGDLVQFAKDENWKEMEWVLLISRAGEIREMWNENQQLIEEGLDTVDDLKIRDKLFIIGMSLARRFTL
jgi:hypothetical protein